MTPGRTRRLVQAALTIALSVWLFAACAAGRPNLIALSVDSRVVVSQPLLPRSLTETEGRVLR